jgi:hypothetical protein
MRQALQHSSWPAWMRTEARFGRGSWRASLPLQLTHAGSKELSARRRKVGRLEFGERALQWPAKVARAQAPDLRPDFCLAWEGSPPPGTETHRRAPSDRDVAFEPPAPVAECGAGPRLTEAGSALAGLKRGSVERCGAGMVASDGATSSGINRFGGGTRPTALVRE